MQQNYRYSQQEPDAAVLTLWGLFSLILVCYGMVEFGATLVKELFTFHFAFVPARLNKWQGLPSIFLHVLLHANLTHLFVNLGMLVAFGIPLVKLVRPVMFLFIFFFAAMSGVLAEYMLDPLDQARRIGASGGVSGLMGALCVYPIVLRRTNLPGPFAQRNRAWKFAIAWIILNTVVGIISPFAIGIHIAWVAHIAGFISGLALGALIVKWQIRARK